MTFQEYILQTTEFQNFDDYWYDYSDDSDYVRDYVRYFMHFKDFENVVLDDSKSGTLADEEHVTSFMEVYAGQYGGMPFFANDADSVIAMMDSYYMTLAENSRLFVPKEAATAIPSVVPATPMPTESVVITSGSTVVVMADSDISFVQLTGVIVYMLAIITGCLLADAIFKRF